MIIKRKIQLHIANAHKHLFIHKLRETKSEFRIFTGLLSSDEDEEFRAIDEFSWLLLRCGRFCCGSSGDDSIYAETKSCFFPISIITVYKIIIGTITRIEFLFSVISIYVCLCIHDSRVYRLFV